MGTKRKLPGAVKKGIGGDVYEVEKLLDRRLGGGRREYLVRWRGWPPEWDSWEDEENIHDPSLLQDLELHLPSQQAVPSRVRVTLRGCLQDGLAECVPTSLCCGPPRSALSAAPTAAAPAAPPAPPPARTTAAPPAAAPPAAPPAPPFSCPLPQVLRRSSNIFSSLRLNMAGAAVTMKLTNKALFTAKGSTRKVLRSTMPVLIYPHIYPQCNDGLHFQTVRVPVKCNLLVSGDRIQLQLTVRRKRQDQSVNAPVPGFDLHAGYQRFYGERLSQSSGGGDLLGEWLRLLPKDRSGLCPPNFDVRVSRELAISKAHEQHLVLARAGTHFVGVFSHLH